LNQPPRRVVKLHHTARRARVSLSHAHTRILSTTVSTPPERVRPRPTHIRALVVLARAPALHSKSLHSTTCPKSPPTHRPARAPPAPRPPTPRAIPHPDHHPLAAFPIVTLPVALAHVAHAPLIVEFDRSNVSRVPSRESNQIPSRLSLARSVARVHARLSSLDRPPIDRSAPVAKSRRRDVARTTVRARGVIINSPAPSV